MLQQYILIASISLHSHPAPFIPIKILPFLLRTVALHRAPSKVTQVSWTWGSNISTSDITAAIVAYNAMEPWRLPDNVSSSQIAFG